jgi:ubiquinone/menaquinone biosynthesis C-methylase UbiE
MDHADHVTLLREGVPRSDGIWADFGSGTGAFSLALANLLGPGAEIYAIDRDAGALRRQESRFHARFPEVPVHFVTADFTHPLDLPPLEGAVMANALHFQQEKEPVLRLLRSYLQPDGRFILVEYNTDRGNHWVPYPLSFQTWEEMAQHHGFVRTHLLATRPSRFLGEIYSALSYR